MVGNYVTDLQKKCFFNDSVSYPSFIAHGVECSMFKYTGHKDERGLGVRVLVGQFTTLL